MFAAQTVLSDAPGRNITVKVCALCHAAETVTSVRHTPEGWGDVIAKMVEFFLETIVFSGVTFLRAQAL